MPQFGSFASKLLIHLRGIIRVAAVYEFTRSVLVYGGQKRYPTVGAMIVFDLLALLAAALLEDEETRNWPRVIVAVVLVEFLRWAAYAPGGIMGVLATLR